MATKHLKNGRSKGSGRFVSLHHFMMETAAWASLTATERSIYVSLAMRYDGKNNGYLGFSAREAAEECRVHKDTACRAFRALEERGFTQRCYMGAFSLKSRHSSEWALTMYRNDRTGEPPTKAFARWRPAEEKRGPNPRSERSL